MTSLTTPLRRLLPAKVCTALETRDIATVEELLWFLPRRHLDRRSDLEHLTEGDYVVFVGTVESAAARAMKSRRGRMLNAVVSSGPHRLALTFFTAYGHEKHLLPGAVGLFAGKVSRYRGQWQLAHPVYEMHSGPDRPDKGEAAGAPPAVERDLVPVYLETPGVPSWTLSRYLEQILDGIDAAADPVPAELTQGRGLPGLLEAMRLVHLPVTVADRSRGLRGLKYHEALVVQTALAQRRRARSGAPAVPRQVRSGGLLEAFDARLPFALTDGQHAVGAQIAADLAQPHPMNRLLQGEVGSGKTVVALRAMLAVIDAGGQAALLAPTEVLAAQHHRSITAMLGDLAEGGLLGGAEQGTRVAVLTGSQSAGVRKAALLDAASGAAGIVVGTHALIQDKVSFADLGLVVVDEQHRFGVEQRDALRGKAAAPPHVLVMTATPIPRTVAMTVFGDMETSLLVELPQGRAPITSHVVDNEGWYDRAWHRVAEEVASGRQAYVVCPRIGEEAEVSDEATRPGGGGRPSSHVSAEPDPDELEELDELKPEEPEGPARSEEFAAAGPLRELRGVLEVADELRAHPALRNCRIDILHGRLTPEQKDAVMGAFAAGDVDVLVSTTVIEVGVDVSNATAMVVLDADRFGVSQLHQLRGRVGRGAHPGLCLLVTRDPPPGAAERLAAVSATTDGVELSRLDLEQRREGDVLGARQSGRGSQLRVLRLATDEALIEAAREDATALVEADPDLEEHRELRRIVEEGLGEEQAAFLERG